MMCVNKNAKSLAATDSNSDFCTVNATGSQRYRS
jgi:hypothetical protein